MANRPPYSWSQGYLTPPTAPTAPTTTTPAAPGSLTPATSLLSPSPSYWKSAPLTPSTDKTSFLRVANALFPFYTAPDQLSIATFLGADESGLFKDYLGVSTLPTKGSFSWTVPAGTVQDKVGSQKVLASQRAAEAIKRLTEMRQQANLTEDQMGPGYKFLTEAISLLGKYGVRPESGEQGMTRAEFEQLQTELGALTDQAKSDKSLAPYAELAQKFINPTGLNLMPSAASAGRTIYGQASSKLFT